LFFELGHEDTDVIWVILAGYFQIDVLPVEVESLGLGALACAQLLRLALQFFEAFLHELDCALRLNRALLIDGSFGALHILNMFRALMVQRSKVRQILLQFLDNRDDVHEVTDSLVRLIRIGTVTPLRSFSIRLSAKHFGLIQSHICHTYDFIFVHVVVASQNNRVSITMNNERLLPFLLYEAREGGDLNLC